MPIIQFNDYINISKFRIFQSIIDFFYGAFFPPSSNPRALVHLSLYSFTTNYDYDWSLPPPIPRLGRSVSRSVSARVFHSLSRSQSNHTIQIKVTCLNLIIQLVMITAIKIKMNRIDFKKILSCCSQMKKILLISILFLFFFNFWNFRFCSSFFRQCHFCPIFFQEFFLVVLDKKRIFFSKDPFRRFYSLPFISHSNVLQHWYDFPKRKEIKVNISEMLYQLKRHGIATYVLTFKVDTL